MDRAGETQLPFLETPLRILQNMRPRPLPEATDTGTIGTMCGFGSFMFIPASDRIGKATTPCETVFTCFWIRMSVRSHPCRVSYYYAARAVRGGGMSGNDIRSFFSKDPPRGAKRAAEPCHRGELARQCC